MSYTRWQPGLHFTPDISLDREALYRLSHSHDAVREALGIPPKDTAPTCLSPGHQSATEESTRVIRTGSM